MSIKISRRQLFLGVGSLTALGLLGRRKIIDRWGPRRFSGEVKGANFPRGHRLLKKDFPKATKIIHLPISIVGSGVSGLSCAYHLRKRGVSEFEIFELENHPGGNSFAMDKIAPWGAHYLPLVNLENTSLINFLKETGAIKDSTARPVPHYNELMLCSDPMEKLYIYGRMQEGIIPSDNIDNVDKDKIKKFLKVMENFSKLKGSDGKYAFDIPMEQSSQDKEFAKLDKKTMQQYLEGLGLSCDSLNWYVNYCCRDDFGMEANQVSAWAGIHYFASRRGKGKDVHDGSVLTWAEGNSFLVRKLQDLSKAKINRSHMLFDVGDNELYFYNFDKNETVKVVSEHIVLALPQFILAKIFNTTSQFSYAPWMVANIKIRWDKRLEGALAWDNVNYHGKGIGFIVANHQSLSHRGGINYLTYYWPLSHLSPKEARVFAIKRTHEQWSEDILKDVSPIISDIEDRILKIDIWPWGHGMIRPEQGFIFNKRKKLVDIPYPNIHVAHTDLGGLSLFEEGFYRGEVAAQKIFQDLKG